MTALIFTFTIFITLTAILCGAYFRKAFYFVVPFLFLSAFAVTIESINYTGFAIDSSFIDEKAEGLILSVTETKDNYLVLLDFSDQDEPRLVKFLKVENKDEMKKAVTKPNQVLRFGKKSGKKTNGPESEGSGAEFEVIGIDESKEFGK